MQRRHLLAAGGLTAAVAAVAAAIDRSGEVAITIYRVVGRVELEQVVTRVAAEPR